MLEIELIGGVEAVLNGEPVALSGRRSRALTVMLALAPGETVSVDDLAVGIWDESPPDHVRGSLQTYVGRLRRQLGDDVIETRPTGYSLLVPRHAVDLLSLWDSAQRAHDLVEPADERAALAVVLERWRGEPFGEGPSDWLVRNERSVWVERRLQVFQRWVDLSFDAHDHRGCLVELNRQAERFPLHEPLWARLLVALDRVGRTAEALERYESVRKRLAEELGVDPSPGLRAVYATLLQRADEFADGPVGTRDRPVPQSIPPGVRGFVGRDRQLSQLSALLPDGDEGPVIALHGPAGSGKTSLALHWAHQVKDAFPGGRLFLNLQGYGPGEPVASDRSLAELLHGLGVSGERIPDGVAARSALLRSETEGRRMLIVLDNARDSEQVRPLLPGPDVLVLVTSRTQLRGLAAREAAHRVRIDQMSPAESVALLQRRLVGGSDERELLVLADLCGHLPVALAVAAERIGREPSGSSSLRTVIGELRDHRNRLDALASSDEDPLTDVRAVLEWSYRSLDDESADVLRHIGLYSAPRISTGAVAALVGAEPQRVARSIDRLTNRHLLTPDGDGYYAMHDLVRDFAAEVANDEPGRSAATRRLRSYLLHSAAHSRLVWQGRTKSVSLPDVEPGVTVEDFDSAETAFDWIASNSDYLRRAAVTGIEEGDRAGHLLVLFQLGYLHSSGSLRDSLELFQRAEESAQRLGELRDQVECANSVALCHYERDEVDAAVEALGRSRDLSEAAGDTESALRAQGNLAVALGDCGRSEEAAAAFDRAVSDARRLGSQRRLGWILFNASDFLMSMGDLDGATDAAVESVDALRAAGEPWGLAAAIDNVGDVQAAAGNLAEAVEAMRQARDAYRDQRLRGDEASALRKLGIFHRDLGETSAAYECWADAIRLLDELGVRGTKKVEREELERLVESLDAAECRA